MSETSYTDRDREIDKVEAFGRLMIRRLDNHAKKGRIGWEDLGVEALFLAATAELGELAHAIIDVEYEDLATVGQVINECGDLAAFAMMIADNLKGLEGTK